MGIRVATLVVAWSGLAWKPYSPRSRLGLPDGVAVVPSRSPERKRWEYAWRLR